MARKHLHLLGLLLLAGCSQGQLGLTGQEPSPTGPLRRAADLLPPQIIHGRNYTIDDLVELQGYNYVFRIRTEYGSIPAKSIDMLELRLREMYSIELAADMSRRAHIMEGVLGSIGKARAGLGELLTDPAGTLMQAPKALKRTVGQALDSADRRAGGETRRRLAAQIGCDPETHNPILKAMLDEMSVRQEIGGFLGGSAMNVVLPGMSVLPTTAEMRQLVNSLPLSKVNARIEGELIVLGVNPAVAQQFCRDTSYTTMERLVLLINLRQLRGVRGLDALVQAASEARTEADGLAVLHVSKMLTELHARRGITTVFRAGLLCTALRDGRHVLLLVTDELSEPQPLAGWVAEYRRVYPRAQAFLVSTARIGPAVKAMLEAQRIKLP